LLAKREFTVPGEYNYNRSGPLRWIISHLLRYKLYLFGFMLLCITVNSFYASIADLTGAAFNVVIKGVDVPRQLLLLALILLGVILTEGVFDLSARLSAEVLSKRFARDAREELYISLLGKSQTFHNRQMVGDIMARASNDMTQLSDMVSPAFDVVFDSFASLGVNIVFIGFLNPQLLLVPITYTIAFLFALRYYSRQLHPVSNRCVQNLGILMLS
jgi:ATP-binding cassette subfamily B protein